ncbi:MAG: penicillin-binding protein activator [Oligoflexia bacterium]|nr:penicillin-binding protein activator [Oligoflexia bacterium]
MVKAFSKKKIAKKAKAQEKQAWAQIQNLKAQSPAEYIKTIDRFIEENKDKEIVLPAYMLKAKILLKDKKAGRACLIYHKVVKLPFYYTNKWKAYRESAKCYFKAGKIKQAVEVLENLIRDPKEAVANKEKAVQLQWSFLKNQKALTAFKLMSLSHLFALSSQLKNKKFWFNTAKNLIDGLAVSDLVIYANQAHFFGELEPYLLYRAGQYFLKIKKFKKAEKYFKKSLSTSLAPHLKKEVKQTLSLMKKISQVNPYLIGAIVPLSGRRQALGEKILRGLYIGLSMDQDSPWQIFVLDSQNHPEVVRTHINDLFYKHHVMGLIGGLTGETAEVMAQKAEEFAIPTVILSQKRNITKNRPFVFQNAITAQQLLTPLIKEIWKGLKIKKTAILYPDDSYGRDYSFLFSELFTKRGGKISAKEMYKPGEVDFKSSIKKLLHLNIKKREKEFEKLKAELLQKKAFSARSLKLTPENILPAQKDFSAVFIPDSLSSLEKVKDHFKYYGVTDIYFLGTNLWSSANIKRKDFSVLFVNLPEKNNKLVKKSDFYKKFMQSYGYLPGHFEQRAYNTALFFKQALEKNIKTRFALQKELKNITNFQGAYYPLSVSKDQVFQYPVEVYKPIVKKAH